MNADQREQLRLSLLRFLDANAGRSTALALLHQYAKNEGRPGLTREEVKAELFYLSDKGLAVKADKILSPENPAFDITAKGRDTYAEFQS